MEETFNLKTTFAECIKYMPPDALSVWLALVDCAARETHPLNIAELASMCNLTTTTVRATLDWLAEVHNEKEPLITINGTVTRRVIILSPIWFSGQPPNPIKITFEKENKKVEQLEEKIRILERDVVRAEVGDSSGIAHLLKGERRDLMLEVEGYYGSVMSRRAYYMLGEMVQGFGPQRVKETFRQKKGSADPLKATYAMLMNGAKGKAAKQKEVSFEVVKYRNLTED